MIYTRHPITKVRFDHALSIEKAIHAMKFNWVHPDIIGLQKQEEDASKVPPPFKMEEVTEMEIVPVSFAEPLSYELVLQGLREAKLREQRIRQLFAFVKQRPDLHRKWPLMALGTVFIYRDYRAFPCVARNENELTLIPEDRIGTEIAPVFIASAI